jgi:DNA-binding response OmpR family regulator/tetratricopeptide (TPR) repeat protein
VAKTILVVEDDKVVQKLLSDVLEEEGFNVICERDGEWALKTFEAKDIDFIILDILIPVMNGFQVAEQIREKAKGKDMPILMVSGIYRGLNHRRDAIDKYNVVDYMDKPLKMEKVIKVLRETFEVDYPSPVATKAAKAAVDKKPPEPYASRDSRQEQEEVEKKAEEFSDAALVGNLKKTSLPELLAQIYTQGSSGALLLKRDRLKKIVYFKKGYPIFVKSNLLNECLGKIMVREKIISEAECEASIKKMKESKRQQGTVLIEMGCISPHNLQYALELQLETKLFELFGWEMGEYKFNPKSVVPPTTTSLNNSTASIIYEGIRRKYDLSRLQSELDQHLDKYVVPHADPKFRFQDMDLDDDEERFVGRLKGQRTLREILDFGLNQEQTYQLIYALKSAGMITLEDKLSEGPVEAKAKAKPKPEEKAESQEESALDQEMTGEWSADDQEEELETVIGFAAAIAAEEEIPQAPEGKPDEEPETEEDAEDDEETVMKDTFDEADEDTVMQDISDEPAEEDAWSKEALTKKVMELEHQDHFEILGVPRDAESAEIKKAFFALAKQYHPDRIHSGSNAEVHSLADEIFNLISAAHDVLSDDQQREEYLNQLKTGKKQDISSEVSKILTAEGSFQKGEMALRKRDFARAVEYFREAVDLCHEEGEFLAHLGWAMFQNDPQNDENVQDARHYISQAIMLNPRIDKAYLFLGNIYKEMNYIDMAENEFEKAIQCNPDCIEALRELRLLGMRKKGKKKKSSGKIPFLSRKKK